MTALFTSALTAALMTAASASASSYTYTTIAVPNAAFTFVESFNNHAAVVGEYQPVGGSIAAMHGFVLSNGQYQTIDPPGSTDTFIVDISDDGTIFGNFSVAAGGFFAFTYKDGSYTVLGSDDTHTGFEAVSRNGLAYGSSTSLASTEERLFSQRNLVTRPLGVTSRYCHFNGVNDSGVSTGTASQTSNSSTRPFVAQAGTRSKIVIPSGAAIQPVSINNAGTVVGYYLDTQLEASRGFIDEGSVITVVSDPNRKKTTLYGVNDSGDMVGVGSDTNFNDSTNEPFFYHNGVFTYLQPPSDPGDSVSANKINSAGQILGTVSVLLEKYSGFLATPVP